MPNKTKDSKPKKHDDELWDALTLAEEKHYNELTLKQAIKVIKRLQWELAFVSKNIQKTVNLLQDCLP